MDALDYLHELFSRDTSIETALHLVMLEYGLSEAEAQKKVDDYFEIIDAIDRERASKGQ